MPDTIELRATRAYIAEVRRARARLARRLHRRRTMRRLARRLAVPLAWLAILATVYGPAAWLACH